MAIGEGRWCDVGSSVAADTEIDDVAPVHVVTAWNPKGRPAPRPTNEAAQLRLIEVCEARQWLIRPAVGMSEVGEPYWAEPSVAIFDISTEEALAVGVSFEQLAIYRWTPPDRLLEVIECEGLQRTLAIRVGQSVVSRPECLMRLDRTDSIGCEPPDDPEQARVFEERRAVLLTAFGCDNCTGAAE